MKVRALGLLFVIVVIMLAHSRYLRADCTELWDTANMTNASHNSFPQIKGNSLVWQARGGLVGATSAWGDWEIFLHNISADTTVQITDDDYDDISPQTDGDYVVWQKHDPTRTNQIFLYKIYEVNPAGGSMISNDDDKDNYSPQVASGRVVWASQRVAHSFEPGEIMLYDARNASGPESISGSFLDCSAPRINNETVIWLQATESGTSALYIYDLATGNTTPAPEGYVWPDSPQTDGNLTVSTRHDGHDREIFLYNSATGKYHQITDNALEDSYPRISENYVAWMADGQIYLAVYTYLALISPRNNAQIHRKEPPTFAWEGIGYHRFKVEFCKDSSFATEDTLAFPDGEEDWLSESPFHPTNQEWGLVKRMATKSGPVYWRVQAKDAEGNVSMSDIWSFTLVAGESQAVNTGVATALDNGDGGACFIGTAVGSSGKLLFKFLCQ